MKEDIRRLMKSIYRVESSFELIQKYLGTDKTIGWLFYILDDGRPHTQKAIAEEWLMPRSTLNDIVKRAKEQDLIELRPVLHTRREKEIILTPLGRQEAKKLLDPIYDIERAALEKTVNKYSDDFIEAFEDFAINLKIGIEGKLNELEE